MRENSFSFNYKQLINNEILRITFNEKHCEFTHIHNFTHKYNIVNFVHHKYRVSLLTFEIPAASTNSPLN